MRSFIRRDSLTAGLLLAAVITCGLMLLWFMSLAFGAMIWSNFAQSQRNKSLVYTREGEPFIETYNRLGDRWQPTYTDLNGKVTEPINANRYFDSSLPAPNAPFRLNRDWRLRITGFLERDGDASYWYLVADDPASDRVLLEGFDVRSKQRLGYLGRKGYSVEPPPLEDRFEITPLMFYNGGWAPFRHSFGRVPNTSFSWPKLYLASGGELLAVDFAANRVEPVPMPAKVLAVGDYQQNRKVGEEAEEFTDSRLAVRLPGVLRLMTIEGELLKELALPAEAEELELHLQQFSNGRIVVEGSRPREHLVHYVYSYDADGKLASQQVADLREPEKPASQVGNWLLMGFAPLPAVQVCISLIGATARVWQAPDWTSAYLGIVREYWLPFAALVLISLVAAVFAYRRQQKYGPRHALAWGVFVLLFGIPGLIGYLLHRRWPHRAKCEHCGRLVPRDSRRCLACQADFSPPAMKGIEVFA